jgi:hypothetical protein
MSRPAREALASAAFRYTLRGLHVFPVAMGAKVPMAGSNGFKDANRDPDVARARWRRWPMANIAATTGGASGFWVLDVDVQYDGHLSLADLEAKRGPLPATIEAATPSGGRHLYWRWPAEGPEIRNSCSRIGAGLDVRGEGGSIVLPPSRLADGRGYHWVKNGAGAFADAPVWLAELVLPPPPPPDRPTTKAPPAATEHYVASAAASELAELERAAEGRRNVALNRAAFCLAGFVLAGALPEDWTKAQLEARAVALGLPTFEVRRTIASAFAAARPRELTR